MRKPMHLVATALVVIGGLALSGSAAAHCAGNHSGTHPHCVGGGGGSGPGDPVYTAESFDLGIAQIDSNSVDNETTIRFRGASLDLTDFVGTWPDGTSCNHGLRTGGFSIFQPDAGNPYTVHLQGHFLSELDSGASKTHIFFLEGTFDEPGNWPPSESDPGTTITLDYWEIYAENKKAQRNDCAGESATVPDPAGPWSVSIDLKTP